MHCPHCDDFNWRHPTIIFAVAIVVAAIIFFTMKFVFTRPPTAPPTLEQIAQPPKTGAMFQPGLVGADSLRHS